MHEEIMGRTLFWNTQTETHGERERVYSICHGRSIKKGGLGFIRFGYLTVIRQDDQPLTKTHVYGGVQ